MASPASADIVHRRFTLDENTYIILLGVAVGVLGGLGNIAFRYAVDFVTHLVRGWLAGQLGIELFGRTRLLLPLLPLTGALLVIPLALMFPGQIYGYRFPGFLERSTSAAAS